MQRSFLVALNTETLTGTFFPYLRTQENASLWMDGKSLLANLSGEMKLGTWGQRHLDIITQGLSVEGVQNDK